MVRLLSFCIIFSSIAYAGKLKTDFYNWPSDKRFDEAATHAYRMKQFQIPFYAGLFSLILLDGNLSKSISNESYLFGSNENAGHISDGLLISLFPLMLYSSTRTNIHRKDHQTYLGQWSKLATFQTLIVFTDFITIGVMKNSTKRIRPDKSDNLSFPSGHSSVSSGLSRMVYNNIENSDLAGSFEGRAIQISAITISSLVAYARVEAKKHHLSDIFLGNAFGAFISDFLYNSFLEKEVDIIPTADFSDGYSTLKLTYRF